MAEIAGIILAAPPLMISFLEHYRECFEVYKCWAKFSGEHRKCKTQIQLVKLQIDLLLNKLLLPVVESEAELEELKQDAKALRVKLQSRICDIHGAYSDALEDLHEALATLQQTLNLHNQELQDLIAKRKGKLVDRIQGRAQYEFLRLKFSGSQKPREKAMINVRTQLEALRSLVQNNDEDIEAKAAMKRRISSSQYRPLLAFWKHAKTLHTLVLKSWSCHCQPRHCVDLQLIHRTKRKINFNIDFIYSQNVSLSNSWNRIEADITCIDLASRTSRVTFDNTEEPLNAIDDMCQALHATKQLSSYEGCLRYDEESYKVALKDSCAVLPPTEMISLHDLLPSLNRRERYQLVITVASSHIQLHFSRWLSTWNTEDIFFKGTSKPDLGRPYLRHKFTRCCQSDHAFSSLGILLLELLFGRLLSTGPDRHDAAWKWLEDVEGDTGEEYAHAVEWCLGKSRVREESNWREDFITNVLSNLQQVVNAQWPTKQT